MDACGCLPPQIGLRIRYQQQQQISTTDINNRYQQQQQIAYSTVQYSTCSEIKFLLIGIQTFRRIEPKNNPASVVDKITETKYKLENRFLLSYMNDFD
jgi:hypothetical protein